VEPTEGLSATPRPAARDAQSPLDGDDLSSDSDDQVGDLPRGPELADASESVAEYSVLSTPGHSHALNLQPLDSMSTQDLTELLHHHNLGEWAGAFAARGVDGPMLAAATVDDGYLENLGIHSKVARQRFQGLVANWKKRGAFAPSNLCVGYHPHADDDASTIRSVKGVHTTKYSSYRRTPIATKAGPEVSHRRA
jgi:hypothetical protein